MFAQGLFPYALLPNVLQYFCMLPLLVARSYFARSLQRFYFSSVSVGLAFLWELSIFLWC